MRLRQLGNIVEMILIEDKIARSDDDYLYMKVCEKCGFADMKYTSAYNFFINRKSKGLPAYVSVSRCRRKLQSQNKNYRADIETEKARAEYEQEFLAMARS